MVKIETGPVTPTINNGWPANNAKSIPVIDVANNTSIAPICCLVCSPSSSEKVIAGPMDVKKMKNVLDRTFEFNASVQSEI
mmetsp:Transcript_5793/g.11782  ORF Transcript_5793/g.11782 Transcript_5793/m.11782 type:complete len:81 (-) Transcript_5793:78-320(-)